MSILVNGALAFPVLIEESHKVKALAQDLPLQQVREAYLQLQLVGVAIWAHSFSKADGTPIPKLPRPLQHIHQQPRA